MHRKKLNKYLILFSAMVIVMSMAGGVQAATVTYDVTADTVTLIMPDTTSVLMWGFGLSGGSASVPGPILEANEGDDLVINLTNNLPEPVTIVIHSQSISSPAPVMEGGRVRSFVPESGSFSFAGLKAGTYLYESGTNTAKQVQMGLYGLLIVHPATAGQAYNDPVSAYDVAHTLLFSDIDPTLHTAVQGGYYGTVDYPSTAHLDAKYFLINGQAFPLTAPFYVNTGDRVLLRFANAGMDTYTPVLNGLRMTVIAEDGFLLPHPQNVAALSLPAGKTKDVIVTPVNFGDYALFDRRLNLTNAGGAGVGGMLTYLSAGGVALAPTIDSFSASSTTIVEGESTTLSWQTSYATSASIDNGVGAQPVDGAVAVSPVVTTTYTLTATGPGGVATATATVTVIPAPRIDSFTATPAVIVEGGSSTLEWATTNVDSVSIDNGIGAQPVDGSIIVSPAATTTYTLTATGLGGTVTATATVAVSPPTIDSFTATPGTIIEGNSSTLEWATTNVTSVSIDNGVGAQPVDGSVVVSPTVTTTYTLTATGVGGTVTAAATVTVIPLPVIDSFTATPSTIPLGNSSTLDWQTTNVDTVSIDNGIGAQPVDGSAAVSPAATITYTLTATGAGGTVTATATVTVVVPITATFTSAAAQDGWVRESTETSNVGGSVNSNNTSGTALRVGDDMGNASQGERQFKVIVSFDTSAIPDGATIISATLKLKRGGLVGTNPFTTHGTCFADIKTGAFGANAVENGDFQAAATAAQVASMSNAAANGDLSTGALNAAGLAAVNKVGLTQMRVYFSVDDNNDNGDDFVGFYSGDNGTAANRPVLEVMYIP